MYFDKLHIAFATKCIIIAHIYINDMKMIRTSSALFLAILTITYMGWSDAVIPVTDETSSGRGILEEMNTLQYCIIDNSTILRLDTGEQLEIIYTQDSILVVAPNGSQTTMEVPRLYNELVCSMNDLSDDIVLPIPIYIYMAIWTIILLLVTSYNIVKHILYKKLHNPMGKLLLMYSSFLAISSVSFFMILTLIYQLSINYHHICHAIKITFIATDIGYEATATCILLHSAYLLWQCHRMRPAAHNEDKILSRYYFGYIIGTMAISMFIILTYDLGTSRGRFTGYCDQHDPIFPTMVTIMHTVSSINSLLQISLFIGYLYYWYKLRNSQDVTDPQINQQIFHIAIAMGATISVANFVFVLDLVIAKINGTNLTSLAQTTGSLMLLLQHCLIVGCLRWVKHVCKAVCKKENKVGTTSKEPSLNEQ